MSQPETAQVDRNAPAPWRRRAVPLFGGQTVSLIGSALVQFAIIWYLTIETQSGLVLGLATVVGTVPAGVISVFGGTLADRVSRKLLVIAADAAIAVSTLVLAVLLAVGIDHLALFLAVLAVRSAGTGVHSPAALALTPMIVPPQHLMRVNSLMGTVNSIISLATPVLAGVLIAAVPLSVILLIDVGTAVIAICLLAGIRVAPLVRSGVRPTFLRDLLDGLAYARRDLVVRWLLVFTAVICLASGAWPLLAPLTLIRTFGADTALLALSAMAMSAGMIIGGAVLTVTGGIRNRVVQLLVSAAVSAVGFIGLGVAPDVVVFIVAMFIHGFAVPYFFTSTTTLLQLRVQPEMHGRLLGLSVIVMTIAMPLSSSVYGPLADIVSAGALLVVNGVLLLIAIVIGVSVPAGRHAVRQDSPTRRGLEHSADGEVAR